MQHVRCGARCVVHDVVRDVVHRADLRAEVEVVIPPLVAEANLRKFGVVSVVEGVDLLAFFLVVYREECGALERVLAQRPGPIFIRDLGRR